MRYFLANVIFHALAGYRLVKLVVVIATAVGGKIVNLIIFAVII